MDDESVTKTTHSESKELAVSPKEKSDTVEEETKTEAESVEEGKAQQDDQAVLEEPEDDRAPVPVRYNEPKNGDDETFSEGEDDSRRSSAVSDRRTSVRTEALIQAAARAVVARIERQKKTQDDEEGDHSILSSSSAADGQEDHNYGIEGTELTFATHSSFSHHNTGASRRESGVSMNSNPSGRNSQASYHNYVETNLLTAPTADELVADSGSNQDDVFSDHSQRSSLGSFEADGPGVETKDMDMDETMTHATRSPRISDISQYDKEEFVPTARGTPRPAFRTPSSVRAIQMSSPPPSVFSSPRSSKRPAHAHALPTISRLGSPSVSAQYSPKGRSTPPRFKARKEAPPLVLLHVTLLPLRWSWGSVLENVGNAHEALSDQAKSLREAWRVLHDRMGDTVLERGILLPHPQNDYEVLEERLLEALDLPLRRRARILECGHYLGPANEFTLPEDLDSEDDDYDTRSTFSAARSTLSTAAGLKKTHWCATCRHEIRLDSLGIGKIFRVKVYASNGLMRAGAWEACWKEMERVDCEIEPIVEAVVQDELESLAAAQRAEQERHEEEEQHEPDHEQDESFAQPHEPHIVSSPPNPEISVDPEQLHVHANSEERRRLDEERLREIYGHTPPPPQARDTTSSMHPHPDSYIPPPTPPSPSEEAFERREQRRRSYQALSLPELLLEAVKVLLNDRKNVVIAILVILALGLSVRTAPREHSGEFTVVRRDLPDVVVTQAQGVLTDAVELEAITSSITTTLGIPCETPSAAAEAYTSSTSTEDIKETPSGIPDEVPQEQGPEAVSSREVVRIVETVTETVKVTATETQAERPTVAVEPKAEAEHEREL
jgi:hypothetical protein